MWLSIASQFSRFPHRADSDSPAAFPDSGGDPMGTEPPRKTKCRRKQPEKIVDYIVVIESWDFSYWLAPNTLRISGRPPRYSA